MCKDCGCEEGNNRAYFHAHGHTHKNGADSTSSEEHIHTHVHSDGSQNVHIHIHIHSSEKSKGHSHGYSHGHSHEHTHEHSHEDSTHTHSHDHSNGNNHNHAHNHVHKLKSTVTADEQRTRTIEMETKVLAHNDALADINRKWFQEQGVVVVNLISSPGSGKTYLLEKTLEALDGKVPCAVITGDQQTDNDAKRLRNKGAPVVQIETRSSCHLNAQQIAEHLDTVVENSAKLLFIENVGNLVCPAAFDLGEQIKIALLSVTEGEDKPLKYPVIFHDAPICVVTKTDLLEHLDVSLDKIRASINAVRPEAEIFELSAKTGNGMQEWIDYLVGLVK